MKKILLIVLFICLLVSITFNVIIVSNKNSYDDYLGNQVANRVAVIVDSSFENKAILNKIIKNKSINKIESHQLYLNFGTSVRELQELKSLNMYLDEVDLENYKFLKIINENGDHFMVQYRSMEKEHINNKVINKEDLDSYRKVLDLMNRYTDIAESTITGIGEKGRNQAYNQNREYVFTSGEWAQFIKELHDKTHTESSPF
ncbi:hypothetical protein [Pontibacillus marinus]|uniref:Uncharacterized protein n=1 Tax=Pontibacillus marinus BH030004 = DSM 16465 TaxID=1385511 RepID=A0A0A5FQZ7_9BACI|nr:hypothetical protein [Pontibacillus marinus]KGX83206.1 hypothetical protein N783_05760 [Pontibacillus marinus BH030004 = DSM 16465]